MLQYLRDQNIKVGDRIRAFDFPGHPDCYVEGTVLRIDLSSEHGFPCFIIHVDKDVWNPPEKYRDFPRIRHTPFCVPLHSGWDGQVVKLSKPPNRAPKTPAPTGGKEVLVDDEEARAEVLRRFGVWGRQSAPARKYALLVAGYFRSRGPFMVEGEEKYLRFFNEEDGRALIELVETSADRPLTASERAEAMSRATGAEAASHRRHSRNAVYDNTVSSTDVRYLRHALDNPQEAARRLLADGSEDMLKFSWLDLLRVMECLRPASWQPAALWTPPTDAVVWARQIYQRRNFTDLPVLADFLEDAEYPDHSLLDHCRNCPEHFRGCTALDLLLGL